MCKKFLSFSIDVSVIFCYWNISIKCTHFIFICHLLMLTYFLCGKYSTISILLLIIYWCWHIFHVQNVLIILDWCLCDFLLLKHIDEVDGLHLHLSLTDVDIFFVWKIFYDFNTAFDYLLMLTYFSCAKCSYHSWLMFMWFSVTETYRWSGWTSSSSATYWCWHIFCVENILRFQYCFWLFTDVDIFFMCQNVLIILDWCLCDFLLLKHIDEVDGLHLHLSFTDVDIFSCWKCPTISILFLIIYWCWLFFMCQSFFKKVSLSDGHKVSLRKFL